MEDGIEIGNEGVGARKEGGIVGRRHGRYRPSPPPSPLPGRGRRAPRRLPRSPRGIGAHMRTVEEKMAAKVLAALLEDG